RERRAQRGNGVHNEGTKITEANEEDRLFCCRSVPFTALLLRGLGALCARSVFSARAAQKAGDPRVRARWRSGAVVNSAPSASSRSQSPATAIKINRIAIVAAAPAAAPTPIARPTPLLGTSGVTARMLSIGISTIASGRR